MKKQIVLWICTALALAAPRAASGQWVQTNGPYGCDVGTLVVRGNTLLAGTRSGMFWSSDSGGNWIATNYGIDTLGVATIVMIANKIYIGTDSGIF